MLQPIQHFSYVDAQVMFDYYRREFSIAREATYPQELQELYKKDGSVHLVIHLPDRTPSLLKIDPMPTLDAKSEWLPELRAHLGFPRDFRLITSAHLGHSLSQDIHADLMRISYLTVSTLQDKGMISSQEMHIKRQVLMASYALLRRLVPSMNYVALKALPDKHRIWMYLQEDRQKSVVAL